MVPRQLWFFRAAETNHASAGFLPTRNQGQKPPETRNQRRPWLLLTLPPLHVPAAPSAGLGHRQPQHPGSSQDAEDRHAASRKGAQQNCCRRGRLHSPLLHDSIPRSIFSSSLQRHHHGGQHLRGVAPSTTSIQSIWLARYLPNRLRRGHCRQIARSSVRLKVRRTRSTRPTIPFLFLFLHYPILGSHTRGLVWTAAGAKCGSVACFR